MDSERSQLQSMRAMARGPSPAPWIAAAFLTALAFAVGRFTRADAPPPPRPRALGPQAPAPELRPEELGALGGCVGELDALQARVDRECPALAQVATNLTDGGVGRDPAEEAAEVARRAAFRKTLVARVAGVTGSAGEWLAEYVCLVDVLRDRTKREIEAVMNDPTADPDATEQIIADAREDLDAILGDVQARLGPQRHARLLEAGGLSMLSLACPDRAGPPQGAARADAGVPEPE